MRYCNSCSTIGFSLLCLEDLFRDRPRQELLQKQPEEFPEVDKRIKPVKGFLCPWHGTLAHLPRKDCLLCVVLHFVSSAQFFNFVQWLPQNKGLACINLWHCSFWILRYTSTRASGSFWKAERLAHCASVHVGFISWGSRFVAPCHITPF